MVPISGWFGKRFVYWKIRVSLNSSSAYFSRFRLTKTEAKLFIEVPMAGWFGKRFAFLKIRVSLWSSSD